MAEAVSYGGGFMLNMHLDKNCQIYAYDKVIINNIGIWLKKNSFAIYGTSRTPFIDEFDWGTVTRKDNMLYFILSGKYPKDGKIKMYMPEYELERADGKLATCIQKNGLT